MRVPLFAACLLVPSLVCAVSAPHPEGDRAELVKGVTELPATGAPGGVSVIGESAFAVLAGKDGKALAAVIAATAWERGRVVAFGHNGYLKFTDHPAAARLLLNAVKWSARGAQPLKIGVHKNRALQQLLTGEGFATVPLDDRWTEQLQEVRVLCIDAHSFREEREIMEVAKFVRGGGGLVTAATGWGWAQTNASKNLATDFLGNRLLLPAGLIFNSSIPGRTSERGFISGDHLALLNAHQALNTLVAHESGKSMAEPAALLQASATVSQALRALPPTDTTFLPRIESLQTKDTAVQIPRAEQPLKSEHGIARLLLTREIEQLKRATPQQFRAHAAAEAFPGAVPRDARAEERTMTLNTTRPGWHSTGLYAAPGALLHVQVPASAADQGLRVRIGCHTDSLWHHAEWKRVPEISRLEKITSTETAAGNPFGGLVYIEVPERFGSEQLSVTIRGAVAAPYFILGKTTADEWRRSRGAPAPWAELECERVILSVPSAAIRQLENPEELMKFWDSVVAAEDELAGVSERRKRPERIVADVQISAGYMHSGYPTMTHLDVVEQTVTLEKMRAGSWGHFHELGHNQQVPDWTFEGTGEVTCNIFSLYVMETLCGKEPGRGHDAMEPEVMRKRLEKHLATRAVFARWKSDPFLALTMYHQLRIGFGWEAYRKVFAEYRDLPRHERPKNDDEKRDQWLVRMSRTCGKNLGPFFEAWGIPTSEAARASVRELPEWMPADWPQL